MSFITRDSNNIVQGQNGIYYDETNNKVYFYSPNKVTSDNNKSGWGAPDFNDPLKPEYYLTEEQKANVKWGINFYDWPLRCYFGTINSASVLNSGAEDIEVFAPAERIIYNQLLNNNSTSECPERFNDIKATTENVIYCESLKAFILYYNNKYYKTWANSTEWNDSITGHARTDTLFSDISPANPEDHFELNVEKYGVSIYTDIGETYDPNDPKCQIIEHAIARAEIISEDEEIDEETEPESSTESEEVDSETYVTKETGPADHFSRAYNLNPAKRSTKIFIEDGNNSHFSDDISTMMTDFGDAFTACISANNGNMHLSDKIYYISKGVSITKKSNFIVDGGNGVIFARKDLTGRPQLGVCSRYPSISTSDANTYHCQSKTYYLYRRGGVEIQSSASPKNHYVLNNEYLWYKLKALINTRIQTYNEMAAGTSKDNYANGRSYFRPYGSASGTMSNYGIFGMSEVNNAIFRNITVRALRDSDDGAPGGHFRFSSSDSLWHLFGITKHIQSINDKGSYHLLFENIDAKGMYEDFDCSGGNFYKSNNTNIYTDDYIEDITIRNWKSDCMQNSLRGLNWNIFNAELTQPDYIGPGIHLFYGQGGPLHGIYVKDSTFIQGKYTSVMLTFHGGAYARDIHFDNCKLYGKKLLQGNGHDPEGWFYITNCYLKQTDVWQCGNDHLYGVRSKPVHTQGQKWSFSNCRFDVSNEVFQSGTSNCRVYLTDCGITSQISGANIASSDFSGYVYTRNFSKTSAEFRKPVNPTINGSSARVKDISNFDLLSDTIESTIRTNISTKINKISTIAEILYGGNGEDNLYEQVNTIEQLPKNANENDKIIVKSTNKLYTCVNAAIYGRLFVCIGKAYTDDNYIPASEIKTTLFTLYPGGGETINFTVVIHNGDNVDDIRDQIEQTLINAGYTASSWSNDNPGTYSFNEVNSSSGKYYYLRVTSKVAGSGTVGSNSNKIINIDSVTGQTVNSSYCWRTYVSNSAKSGVNTRLGVDAVWDSGEDYQSSGLVGTVQSNTSEINTIKAKIQSFGRTNDRPTLSNEDLGYFYFDIQLNKPIWYTKIDNGTVHYGWVDASGTEV